MRTQEEAEAWARQHGAVLKVNFVDGDTSLHADGFVSYAHAEAPFERALPQLVADLERQMADHPTQSEPAPDASLEEPTRPR
jgi:hypothetical protein